MQEKISNIQKNPLLPGYQFGAYLVAGHTPIERNEELDFIIDRPNGMSGYIINLTTEGIGSILYDDMAFNCTVGDLLLFPPQIPHYYQRAKDSNNWHHQWIYFRPRSLWDNWLRWENYTHGIGRLTIKEPSIYQDILSLFKEIEKEYTENKLFSQEMSMCLLEKLLIKCSRLNPSNSVNMLDSRIISACQFISDNLDKNYKISDIADHVHISPSRLTHLFSEQLGTSIVKWREEQRMIKAQHLLHISKSPIYYISRQLGYDDQLYFSRLFKRYTGLNPSEYRNSR
ncbi:arabinose operon transcriptional regulator AraC [Avibacterium avium]|uniref:arabinose operon transcriptional regulator AraC n=1 Tax=Avibacterium avium TaxID=751 RepID=UPI003BF8F9BB